MSPSTQSLDETDSLVTNLEIHLGISRIFRKTLKEQTDQHDGEMTESRAKVEVVSESWRDKKRLYPPFRGWKKEVSSERNQQGEETIEKSIPEPMKFPLSTTLELGESHARSHSSFGCCDDDNDDDDDEISLICDAEDVPCIGPICRQDNEPCTITWRTDHTNDVCQDSLSAHGDKLHDESISACAESIDYVSCRCGEEPILSAAFEEETWRDDLGEREYFDNYNEDSVKEHQLQSVSKLDLEFGLFEDPCVSHRLTIPYKDTPSPRFYVGGSLDDSSRTILLPKRPQSPVRNILKGRYNVHTGIAEIMKRAEFHYVTYTARKSKESLGTMINSDIKSTPTSGMSTEPLITCLKVLLDDVKLSTPVGESENDLSLTLATIWALTEFVISEPGSVMTQSVIVANLGAVPKSRRSLSHNLTLLKSTSFQKTSDIGYPPKGSDNHFLHRALPWSQLCAAHAEGLPKNYATVRTYIDEVTPDIELEKPRPAYLPDISCAHLREMPIRKPVLSIDKSQEFESKNSTQSEDESTEHNPVYGHDY